MIKLEELLSPNEALKCAKAGVNIKKDAGELTLIELWKMSSVIVASDQIFLQPKVEVGLKILLERSAKKRVSLFLR